MLKIENLTKSFGPVTVLKRASETFHSRAVHGLVGANGAGKSTLIKILSGFHPASAGSILLEGRKVAFSSPRDAFAAGIRTLQQETDVNLFTSLTVLDNIVLRTENRRGWQRLVQRADRANARRRLALVGADDIPLSRPVAQLPLARRQQVALASALDENARVLILDEPTAALDRHDAERLLSVLDRLRQHGAAIIYVSHHLPEVIGLADRVTVLREGQVIDRFEVPADRDPAVLQPRLVVSMMGTASGERAPGERPVLDKVAAKKSPPLLRIDGLVTESVDRISFTIQEGEVVVLTGLLGAGMGAVLKAVYGLQPVRAGRLEIAGRVVPWGRPADMVRRGVGLVPDDRQRLGLHLDESIVWNSTLPVFDALSGAIGFLHDGRLRPTAEEVAQRVHLVASRLTFPARALSGGNQQKLVLAKWLTTRRKLILLHEPTRGVDVSTRNQIYALLRRLVQDEGMAILCATYDFDEALRLGDRIIVMRRGTIAWETAGESPTERQLMDAAMGGQP